MRRRIVRIEFESSSVFLLSRHPIEVVILFNVASETLGSAVVSSISSACSFRNRYKSRKHVDLCSGEDMDAASAGFRVGYEYPAYFSRDYKKLFGAVARHSKATQ